MTDATAYIDDLCQELTMAVIRLQNATDKNFVIMQLEDLLKEMVKDIAPVPNFDDPIEDSGC